MTTSSSLWQHIIFQLLDRRPCWERQLLPGKTSGPEAENTSRSMINNHWLSSGAWLSMQLSAIINMIISTKMIITTSLIINMIISRSGSRIIIISRLLTIINLVISTSRSIIITIIAIIRIIIRSCWLPKLVFHYIIFSNIEPLPSFCQCVHFGGNKHKNVHEIYNSELTDFQPEEINRVTSNV